MELRQLEYFVTVADEASFTRAAAKVHVAQPGVSAQIRRLERELGHPLLDRTGRSVRLTEAGAAVLPYARAALGAVDAARLAVDELAGLIRGRVAVGMVIACPAADLADLLATFHKRHPAVEISLCEANSDHLLQLLRDGHLDLAIVGLAGPAPAGISHAIITEEPLVAAVHHGHALAARTSIPLTTLRNHPLIALPPGTGLRTALDHALRAANLQAHIAFEATDPRALIQLATRGLGVAVLAESMAHTEPALHPLPITRPTLRSRLALAWRTDAPLGPAAKTLLDQAKPQLARR
jgi:DNA-binding transcriptional LysR family regulator